MRKKKLSIEALEVISLTKKGMYHEQIGPIMSVKGWRGSDIIYSTRQLYKKNY